MADKKISELVSLAGVDLSDADLVPVVDVSTAEAKAVSISGIKAAFAATFSSQAQTEIYTTEALGRAAVADSQAFKVQGSGDVAAYEYRRTDASTSVLIATYPSVESVQKPSWAGRKPGWPDPCFREIALTSSQFGRSRFYNLAYWQSITSRAGSPYDGRSLVHAAGVASSSGMYVWLDEIDASEADTVGFGLSLAGAGGRISVYYRWETAAGVALGSDTFVQTIGPTVPGTNYTVTAVATVPSTAGRLRVYMVHGAGTPYDFYVDAFWAARGAVAAQAPVFSSTIPYGAARMTAAESTITTHTGQLRTLGDSISTVSFSSMSVRDAVTSVSIIAASSTFAGFGENRTPPSPIVVDAVRAPGTTRVDAITNYWATLYAEIRDGGPTGTLLASGSVAVDPEINYLGEVVIPLNTPITLSAKYFVGWYARNRDGTAAVLGEARGTSATRDNQTYYRTTASDVWTAYSGNPAQALELVELTGESISSQLRSGAKLEPIAADPSLLTLPAAICALVGQQRWIYFDAIVRGRASDYEWDVSVSGGVAANYVQLNEGLRITPTATGNATLTITAIDPKSGRIAGTATTVVQIAAAAAGAATAVNVLFVGDSLTVGYVDSGTPASGEMVKTVRDLSVAEGGGGLVVTLLGTKGSAPNVHEGVTGQTVDYFRSNVASPFVFSGSFNFAAYMAAQSYSGVEFVFFQLGTNDVSSAASDGNAETLACIAAAKYEEMIASIHAYDSNTKVIICAPPPPAAEQNAFGASYSSGLSRSKMKRHLAAFAKVLQRRFEGRTAEKIYFAWPGLNLDTTNNMSRAVAAVANSRTAVTVARQSDGIHPALEGYRQLGDAMWSIIKFNS